MISNPGVVSLVFKYCDDHQLPLLDLKDLRTALRYLSNEGKAEIEKQYGRISGASVGAIMRKIVEIEEQGAELFFRRAFIQCVRSHGEEKREGQSEYFAFDGHSGPT